jgi:UDP-N-acetylglucosamine diphosphorylase / glucose-1-phosphate thymidylyltransferase / UDP-N-acetylgalactosamine diphosphorylase / glucosamine-1-phosphate N-acetyltransferase / galactosamine-1-phosphate N-acetyltransferase
MEKELRLDYYFEDMNACPCSEAFEGITYLWEALKKKDKIVDFSPARIEGEIDKTVIIKGAVTIGKETKIDPYVVIEGPVIIGERCHVRPFALIRPGTIIGNNCVVGSGAEVKNVIAFDEVKIASHTFVGDAICGKGARVGSGTIVGNRRFDQKNATVRIDDRVIDVGNDKYGGIMGDYTRLGANCVTSPGFMIGKHTWVYAGCLVRGVVPKESLLKLKQETLIVNKGKHVLSHTDVEGKI